MSDEQMTVHTLLQQAVDLHRANFLSEAERLYEQVLTLDKKQYDALHLLGLIQHKKGNYSRAVQLIKSAIALAPKQLTFHLNLGLALKEQGHFQRAEKQYRQALKLDPHSVDAHYYLANLLYQRESYPEAISYYTKALALAPERANLWKQLGRAYRQSGQTEKALHHYQAAVKQHPTNAYFSVQAIKLLLADDELDKAQPLLQEALQQNPDSEALLQQKAIFDHKTKAHEEAIHSFKHLIEKSPDKAQYHHNLGVCYFEAGELDQAKPCFEKAIDLDPQFAQAYYNYSQVKKFNKKDPYFLKIQQLLKTSSLCNRDQAECHFALAKMYDDCDEPNTAFFHLKSAHQLKKVPFDKSQLDHFVSELKMIFTRHFIQTHSIYGSGSNMPIFIVGLPRSGTTLLEQIIASHSQVTSGGELKLLGLISTSLRSKNDPSPHYPLIMKHINPNHIKEMAAYYLQAVAELAKGFPRIVDKMPYNFFHIGLIQCLFPQSKIIHCRRDVRDTALSIYFQNFRHPQKLGNTLESIGYFINAYQDMMHYWELLLPNKLYAVDYEALVTSPKKEIKSLIERLELPWEKSCLDFYNHKRHVRTASIWQVRQPIYKSSLNKWEKYRDHLKPLLDVLQCEA